MSFTKQARGIDTVQWQTLHITVQCIYSLNFTTERGPTDWGPLSMNFERMSSYLILPSDWILMSEDEVKLETKIENIGLLLLIYRSNLTIIELEYICYATPPRHFAPNFHLWSQEGSILFLFTPLSPFIDCSQHYAFFYICTKLHKPLSAVFVYVAPFRTLYWTDQWMIYTTWNKYRKRTQHCKQLYTTINKLLQTIKFSSPAALLTRKFEKQRDVH